MAIKELIERIKSFNAIVSFSGTIVAGLGVLAAVALFTSKKVLGVIVDPETAIEIMAGIIVLQALLWVVFVIAFILRKNKKADTVSDTQKADAVSYTQFRIAIHKLIRVWSGLAASTAECDSRIFEYLFLYRLVENGGERPAFDLACRHIVEILDQAARAFKILTNDECAVTIKCAVQKSDSLQTLHRDKVSNQSRGGTRDMKVEQLSDNRPMDAIAIGRLAYYASDDLKAAYEKGDYTNSRGDWVRLYNATVVHPIEIYAAGERKKTTRPLSNMTFMVCVDNKKGGLSDEISLETIRYVASRVSALLYRAEILKI